MKNDRFLAKLLTVLGIGSSVLLSIYQLYTSFSGVFITNMVHYGIHLLLVAVIFLSIKKPLYKINYKLILIDFLIIISAIYALTYTAINYAEILSIVNPNNLSIGQYSTAWIIFLLILYTTFRVNIVFFILCLIMIFYGLFGNLISGPFQHAGLNLERLVYLISFSSDGIFGTVLGVSATYLFIFIFFGVVLEKTGTGDFIMKLSQALVGKYTGGTAKTSLFASAGIGSVVGSSVGNVVATGSFTIPIMKKTGFRPHVAASIEAVASEGGQMLPPILGAAAFIMAQITGIPYTTIAIASLIPAILYFVSIFFVIDFEARKFNIKGIAKDKLPVLKEVILDKGHLIFSILLLFYLLIFINMGVLKAGFITVITALGLAMLRKNTRLKMKDFYYILRDGAQAAVEIAMICASMGIITGVVVFTGIGVRLAEIILSFSGENLLLTLLLAMVVTIILGMGLPTPVAYMLGALFIAPALIDVGVSAIAAHMFIFFFAIKSGTTPPVAIVAVVAAGIAKANWFRTAITATLFSLPSFIIAYMFIYENALLMIGEPITILTSTLTALIGVIGLAGTIQGWWLVRTTVLDRILLCIGSLLLVYPNIYFGAIGLTCIIFVTIIHVLKKKKNSRLEEIEFDNVKSIANSK